MFRREKTAARQMVGAIAGVTAIAVATWYVYFDRTPATVEITPPRVTKSLLAGQVEPHDAARQTCFASTEGGLSMTVKERTGTPATCCVVLGQPLDLKTGDEFSARALPERAENDFFIGLVTADGRSISMTRGRVYGSGSENIFRLTLDRNGHLEGKESTRIVKFCISAAGPGEPNTINVPASAISAPR